MFGLSVDLVALLRITVRRITVRRIALHGVAGRRMGGLGIPWWSISTLRVAGLRVAGLTVLLLPITRWGTPLLPVSFRAAPLAPTLLVVLGREATGGDGWITLARLLLSPILLSPVLLSPVRRIVCAGRAVRRAHGFAFQVCAVR